MRIISGTYKGRRIHPPSNLPVRPTTDMAREALFNVLNNRIDFESLKVLDLFSGTGAVSYEFISRGVMDVTAIEMNSRCIAFIKKATLLFEMNNLRVLKRDVFRYLQKESGSFNLIFADPPFKLPNISSLPDYVFNSKLLAEDGLFILEHGQNDDFSEHQYFFEQRNYGSVNFSFFQKKEG